MNSLECSFMGWLITIILTLIMCLGYFILLLGTVGFVQNKKFFSSAPKEIKDAVTEKKERFKNQHILGYIMLVLAFVLLLSPVAYQIYYSIKNDIFYWFIVIRIIIMLFGLELFDIILFDYVLLCHSNFFPHYYPEVKNIVGPHLFGYNKWVHFRHFIIYVIAAFLIAWICILF